MSEEGGLEDVEESLRAAASCCWSWATVAVSDSTWACRVARRAPKCWHPAQDLARFRPMDVDSTEQPSSRLYRRDRLPTGSGDGKRRWPPHARSPPRFRSARGRVTA